MVRWWWLRPVVCARLTGGERFGGEVRDEYAV